MGDRPCAIVDNGYCHEDHETYVSTPETPYSGICSMAVDAVDTYTLICENWIEAIQAGQDYHFELPVSERCNVAPGDVVGWGHEGQGTTRVVPVTDV